MVIFQGGTGLWACATLPPQVSCSVHCMLAGRILLQGLQQESGLIHPEKPTAKREGRLQVGVISGRTWTDPTCTPASARDTKYSCQISPRKPPYPFMVPIGSLDELAGYDGLVLLAICMEPRSTQRPQAAHGQCMKPHTTVQRYRGAGAHSNMRDWMRLPCNLTWPERRCSRTKLTWGMPGDGEQ